MSAYVCACVPKYVCSDMCADQCQCDCKGTVKEVCAVCMLVGRRGMCFHVHEHVCACLCMSVCIMCVLYVHEFACMCMWAGVQMGVEKCKIPVS